MKKLKLTDLKILLVLLFACSVKLQAQVTDTMHAIRRDSLLYKNNNQQYLPQYYSKLERDKDSITESRLVELALQQPKFDEEEAQRKTIDYQLEKQRKAWLNLLSVSANYNDQSFAGKRSSQTAYVYPRYFFGLTIPLGLIFAGGTDYKITKESGIIVKDQALELQQTIKANVLSDYKQYRTYDKLIAIQNQQNDDAQAYYLQMQQKFSEGTATFEAYNDASVKYNDGVVKSINLKLQQDLIKVDLEKLIGRRLEDIFK